MHHSALAEGNRQRLRRFGLGGPIRALTDDLKVDLVAENIHIDHTHLNGVTKLIGLTVLASDQAILA